MSKITRLVEGAKKKHVEIIPNNTPGQYTKWHKEGISFTTL
jgi:hypothetical protein